MKIKVLLIGYSYNLGGIEIYLFNLIKNANKDLFQFDILYMGTETLFKEDELKKMGCNIFKITKRKVNYKKSKNEFLDVIKNNEYDFVHFNLMSLSWFEPIIWTNKYSSSKIIIHSHNGNIGNSTRFITKMLHNVGKMLISNIPCCRVACGELAGRFMFRNKQFTIFNNGIDVDKFMFSEGHRKELRNKFKIGDTTTVYGLTARLEKQKNVLFLVDIFYELTKLNENSKLCLVGSGSLEDDIKKKVADYGIDDKILLLGKKIDAYKFYSLYDVFVMPSECEGFAISLIEAQTNGLKCYASSAIDKLTNLTGNVKFISLEKSASEWAKEIYESENGRDENAAQKIPDEFNSNKSYKKVYEYYKSNLK